MLVIHALLDSASVSGAFRFTLRAGEATIIDTELTLFARAEVDHLGLGSMAGAYLFGSLDHLHSDDVRKSVHDVGGLQILTGSGEWIWRPVANRTTLQISAFGDRNPHGFGMLQRNRSFDAYEDDESHWEMKPSLWIEPIGDWGDGEVLLLEIPSDSETNDNIIAQWRPKAGLAAGGSVSFAYRQFWCWTPPARPDLAVVASSRVGKVGKRRRFAVEFVSDQFADPQRAAEASAAIEAAPGQIAYQRLYPYHERRSIRVVFDLDPGSESYSELQAGVEGREQAGERDVALSMDSVMFVEADDEPTPPVAREEPALAPAMPREAPLAMPVQSLYRFSRRSRRRWIHARQPHAVRLARLVAFGGALLLTAYGAREMYGVVSVGQITVSRMGDGRAVRDQLFLDRARLHGQRSRVLLICLWAARRASLCRNRCRSRPRS